MNTTRVSNEIYACRSRIEMSTDRTFRRPFLIASSDLAAGPVDPVLKTYYATVHTFGHKKLCEVCEVTIHCKPESDAVHNLLSIEPARHYLDVFSNHIDELVALDLSLVDAPDVTLSYGILTGFKRHENDVAFDFLFSQIMRDHAPV